MSSTVLEYFLFSDTAATEISPLSRHDSLPVLLRPVRIGRGSESLRPFEPPFPKRSMQRKFMRFGGSQRRRRRRTDRKSTRLNSSHANISYAVFCLQNRYGVSDAQIESGRKRQA